MRKEEPASLKWKTTKIYTLHKGKAFQSQIQRPVTATNLERLEKEARKA